MVSPPTLAEPAHPAAEGQAAHAGVADQPGRDREAVGLGRRVDVGQQRPAGHRPRAARPGRPGPGSSG